MKIKDIKVGVWYKTRFGTGKCEKVGGTFPPTVKIGGRLLSPRDVERPARVCSCHNPPLPVSAHPEEYP